MCGGGMLRLADAARPVSRTHGMQYAEVHTPEAFRAALRAGVRHVVVSAHLDFSAGPGSSSGPLHVAESTRSIRVRSYTQLNLYNLGVGCQRASCNGSIGFPVFVIRLALHWGEPP